MLDFLLGSHSGVKAGEAERGEQERNLRQAGGEEE